MSLSVHLLVAGGERLLCELAVGDLISPPLPPHQPMLYEL